MRLPLIADSWSRFRQCLLHRERPWSSHPLRRRPVGHSIEPLEARIAPAFAAVIELSGLTGADGFKISGEAASDFSAFSVSAAGDINGDGIDDVIVGAYGADPNGNYSGASYVVFGSESGFTPNLNLSTLTGSNGFKIGGEVAGDYSGFSVSAAGDINGDGIDDVIIGAAYADPNGNKSGASYVVFGSRSGFTPNLNLATLTGTNGFKLSGEAAGDQSGRAVSRAGDINGDGIDDVIVGAFRAAPNGIDSGASYVVFGSRSGFAANLNLSALTGSNGFKVSGAAAGDQAGRAVSAAGDINGDGIDDVIIGADYADPNGNKSGVSYVVFGSRSGFAPNLNLATLVGGNGFKINGEAALDYSGRAVSGAGDINGDGIDDLIVGAYGADPNGNASGASYVVFGSRGGFAASLELSGLTGANGFKINGAAVGDFSGNSVSATGDVNGDGIDDLIIGAERADPNGSISGASYVVFGSRSGFAASLELSGLTGANGFKINGAAGSDFSGNSVSAAGDVNGDGIDDLIVGAYAADPNGSLSGASYVIFGQPQVAPTPFAPVINLSGLTGTNGLTLNGEAANDASGISVRAAGDINGDGIQDVIIGANASPNGTFSGASYVVFGSTAGFGANVDLSALTGVDGFKINGVTAFDRAYSAGAAGDINGDGIDDLIIGASGADPNGGNQGGASYVVFGSRGGFGATVELSALTGANGFTINGVADQDGAGGSVSAAGDLNGDGIDDVIIGANGADPNGSSSGASYVVFGSRLGFGATLELSALNGTNGFKISGVAAGDQVSDQASRSVSAAGDINGDGIDDVIIGAPGADPNGPYSGSSYVVFGSRGGFAANLNLSTLNGANGFKISGVAANDYSGRAVSAAGDINGDGIDDLIVGADQADPNGNSSGASYVVFGSRSAFAATLELSALTGSNGFRVSGAAANDLSGFSVSAAGDVNGDGIDDLMIGAYLADPNGSGSGASYVVFGRRDGFGANLNLSALTAARGFKISGVAADDRAGYSVGAAGDFNGDGIDDVIIGALRADPNGTSSGASYVVFGHRALAAAPSTTVALVGGDLIVLGSDNDDGLILSLNGINLRVTDPATPITAGAGAVQVDPKTVDVPLASVTGGVNIDAGLGVDSVTLAAGLPGLNGLTIVTETLAALPALTVNGALSLASTDTDLTQTAPLSVTGPASFAVGAHSIALTNPGNDFTGAVSLNNSGLNAVAIIDTNALALGASSVGTGALSATAGSAFTVTGAINFGGDLNLTAGGADQPVSVQGVLTKASGGDAIALLKATGDVRFENSGGLTVSAPGLALTLSADSDATGGGGVFIDAGSVLATNGGNVTIGGGASPGTTPTGGLVTGQIPGGAGINYGVEIIAGSAINAGAGNVSIRGHGRDGAGTFAVGLEIQGSVTTTTGSITLVGTGGNATVGFDSGVQVGGGGLVESTAGGSIVITGTGAGTGASNRGVNIGGGTVRTTSAGSISLAGTGSATGTGTANYGVDVQGGGAVSIAGSGGITINAISGAGSAAFHTLTGTNRVGFDGTNPYSGAIALNADSMSIDNAAIQTTGTVTLRPRTNGALIDLGGADSAGTLGLTDAELDQVTAGTVQIGDGNSGAITVSAAITHPNDLSLTTGAGLTFNDAVTLAVNKSFTANALGTTTGAINFATANADLAASGTGAISLTTLRNIALAGGSSITTVDGALTLVADQMSFAATSTISAQGTGGVTLLPRTNGTAINLGSTVKTTPGTLELSDAELDRVTAGRINLGGSTSGAITVSAAITRPAPTTLALLSGAGMVNLDALLDTGGGTLLFAAGTYQLHASNLIAATTAIDIHGGTFDLGAFNDTVQGVILDGGRIIGSGMLTSATAFDVRSGRIDARLGGSGGLVKSSPGTVILGNAQNTFTGTVTIIAGILQVAADGAFGAAANPLAISNATLRTTATFNSPRAITLSGPATFDVVFATTLTLTGAVTGPGPLVQTGGGTLVIGYTFTKDDSSITIVSGAVNVAGSVIALGGTGIAVVKKGPGPNQIQSIELSGTTTKTSLSVKSPAGIITEIAKIISANPADSIGKIVLGKGVRFGDGLAGVASDPAVADMAIAGKLGKLTFDGVSANTLVTLGKGLPYNANPANPTDPTPDTYNHKPELTINQILGAGVTFDLTPLRDNMGAYVRDEFGNFVGGGGLGKVAVGEWGANGISFPGVIKTTQSITSFILKKGDCNVTFEVDKDRVGQTTPGNVGTIKVLNGSWTSTGNVIDGFVGLFDVGGFTARADLRADYIQKKFLVRGTFTDINGVAYGGTTILDQDVASGAFNISVGDFTGRITATGAIGKFVANGTFSGALTAKSIVSITADEFLKIGATGPVIKSTGGAIGSVTTKFGGIASTTIESSTNIGKISAKGSVMGSKILAGADPGNNGAYIVGDPTPTGTIGALVIAGTLEASTIAARTLDAITFRYGQAATTHTVLPAGISTTLIALQGFTSGTVGLKVGTAPTILNTTFPALGRYYFTFLAGANPLGTIQVFKL